MSGAVPGPPGPGEPPPGAGAGPVTDLWAGPLTDPWRHEGVAPAADGTAEAASWPADAWTDTWSGSSPDAWAEAPATTPGGAPAPPAPRRRRAQRALAARPSAGGLSWKARAAGVTAGLGALGSVLGLVRDQGIAHLFGAGPESDAFLVAWTVPEVAATVLIEDAMALLMVPAFSAALAAGGGGARGLVRGTLPRLLAALGLLTAGLAAGAPWVVRALAPGLADPATAVTCTRLTALTVLAFGLAGYLSAALRAHRRFVPPAAIYVAYNTGIVTVLLLLHGPFGVRAAAAGVAVGGALMIAVQLPAFVRVMRASSPHDKADPCVDRARPAQGQPNAGAPWTPDGDEDGRETDRALQRLTAGRPQVFPTSKDGPGTDPSRPNLPGGPLDGPVRRAAQRLTAGRPQVLRPGTDRPEAGGGRSRRRRRAGRRALGWGVIAPVVVFTLGRQAQVLVERWFAAPLPAGAISHLNYAEKVAQLPMALSVMLCTVTFPALSRALAEGDRARAERRVRRDLTLACVVVLTGTAYVLACAPQIVEVLFQRGEFTASDTAATASVMRVYALGLLGQSLVGALIRPYFSAAAPTWFPAAAMAAGLLLTGAVDAAAAGPWGTCGIAAGNAAGITLTAALLLRGLRAHAVAVPARALAADLGRITLAAGCATAAGWCVALLLPGALTAAAACALAVPAVFAAAALAVRAPGIPHPLAAVTRKDRP